MPHSNYFMAFADRKRTRRSPTPESRRRQGPDTDSYVPKYDRSSYRRRDRSPPLDDRRQPASDRDSYVPDYERDGYHPAPRHPDHDNGPMGSYGSSFSRGPPNPYKLDYIVSFRQFADYLRQEGIIQAMPKKQDGDKQSEEYEAQTQEIKRRYDIYKENFQHKQLRRFFEYHMDEEWMIERYHPTAPEKEAREKKIKNTKKNLLSKWLNELGAERFDNVLLDEPETKEGQENPVSEDDPDFKDKVELARRTVFIRIVPNMVKRSTVLELVQNIGGFQYLALSEPRQYQLNKPPPAPKPDSRIPVHMDLLSRVGWVVFDSPEDAAKAQKELENKSFPGLKSDDSIHAVYSPDQTINFRYKLTPSDAFGSEDRMKVDLANVKQLVEKLDKVWGCENGGKALKQKIETLLANRRESRNEETDEDRLNDSFLGSFGS
ncbi:hypothetical protein BKA69DRAFT_22369 [Paraphysoderma sedebokerense]|nr:hypothetical protein BKA69DRAFT_22369 [Paraphysoderma sedebokerense]